MRFRETLTQLQGSFYIVYTLQGPPPLGPNHFYTQSEGGGKARVWGGQVQEQSSPQRKHVFTTSVNPTELSKAPELS